MRVLMFDDDRVRHELVKAALPSAEVVNVYLWSQFEKELEGPAFDVMMLDHDLNDLVQQEAPCTMYGHSAAYDGKDAAHLVASLPESKRPQQVVIHSVNPEGALRMADIIQSKLSAQVIMAPYGSTAFLDFLHRSS